MTAANCRGTVRAANVGYIVQSMINNFAPLLFITFQNQYQVTLTQISVLIAANFCAQIVLDVVAAALGDKVGYRPLVILAQVLAAAGIIGLALLPEIMPPFVGLLISVVVYGSGGGLTEVLLTPIVEACPIKEKDKAVSMLHSFYCWGGVGVIIVSTAFFKIFGLENWKIMCFIWAVIPVINAISFARVPIYELVAKEKRMTGGQLAKNGVFWLLLIFMFCTGACEMALAQWASAFAEEGLGVSKSMGDLLGPCMFLILKGIERVGYARIGHKIPLWGFMVLCALLSALSYFVIGLVGVPGVSLAFFAVAGFANGVMWPGTFSLASRALPQGGTVMFGMLALCGDLGCAAGPLITGLVSRAFGGSLQAGLLFGTVFGLLLAAGLFLLRRVARSATEI